MPLVQELKLVLKVLSIALVVSKLVDFMLQLGDEGVFVIVIGLVVAFSLRAISGVHY